MISMLYDMIICMMTCVLRIEYYFCQYHDVYLSINRFMLIQIRCSSLFYPMEPDLFSINSNKTKQKIMIFVLCACMCVWVSFTRREKKTVWAIAMIQLSYFLRAMRVVYFITSIYKCTHTYLRALSRIVGELREKERNIERISLCHVNTICAGMSFTLKNYKYS